MATSPANLALASSDSDRIGQEFKEHRIGKRVNPWAKMFALGLVAGLLNSLIGFGGGIVIVPGLIWIKGTHPKRAITISLGTILVMSFCSMIVYLSMVGSSIGGKELVLLALSGIIGAQTGSRLLFHLPRPTVLYVFSAFCLFCSIYLTFKAFGWLPLLLSTGTEAPWWAYSLIGLASGFSSGLMGIGGGIVIVLAFSVVVHVTILSVVPVALAMNLANAASGLAAHGYAGRLDRQITRSVLCLVPACWLGIAIGVPMAVMMPADGLRIIFAVTIFYFSLHMFRRGRAAAKAKITELALAAAGGR